MNCKQGDLAIAIRSTAGNEGKIFQCLRFIGQIPDFIGNDYWQIDRVLMSKHGYMVDVFRDSFIRPIRDQDGQDETLTWLDVPSKEIA